MPVPPPRPTSAPAEESPPGKFSSFFSLFGTKNVGKLNLKLFLSFNAFFPLFNPLPHVYPQRTSRTSLVSLGEESRESIHIRPEESDQSPRLIDASVIQPLLLLIQLLHLRMRNRCNPCFYAYNPFFYGYPCFSMRNACFYVCNPFYN